MLLFGLAMESVIRLQTIAMGTGVGLCCCCECALLKCSVCVISGKHSHTPWVKLHVRDKARYFRYVSQQAQNILFIQDYHQMPRRRLIAWSLFFSCTTLLQLFWNGWMVCHHYRARLSTRWTNIVKDWDLKRSHRLSQKNNFTLLMLGCF